MADILEQASRGCISTSAKWPPYKDPYSPASPWSIAIALVSVTSSLDKWLPAVRSAPTHNIEGKAEPLQAEMQLFIEEECRRWGWVNSKESDDRHQYREHFVKTRLRQSDAYAGSLEWDTTDNQPWYSGVAAVLREWRLYSQVGVSLAGFESLSHQDALLRMLPDPHFVDQEELLKTVSTLAIPYARYFDCVDIIVRDWLSTQDLQRIVVLSAIPELRPALEEKLLNASPDSLPFVESSFPAFHDLAKACRDLCDVGVAPCTIQTVVDWRDSASESTQSSLLIRFLRSSKNWKVMGASLSHLKQAGLLRKVPDQDIDRTVIRVALETSRFMFLQSHTTNFPETVLSEEVVALVKNIGKGVTLRQAQTACGLLKTPNMEAAKLMSLMEACRDVGLELNSSTISELKQPLRAVQYALRTIPGVYKRPEVLEHLSRSVGAVNSHSGPNYAQIIEMCIESALANDKFEDASTLCEQLSSSPLLRLDSDAWLAFLQVAKFLSPQWNVPRPMDALLLQKQLLSQSLGHCPAVDLPAALSTWNALEQEETLEERLSSDISSLDNTPSAHETSYIDSSGMSGQEPPTSNTSQSKRGDLQNLLVSGIGWAIGAPPIRD